MSKFQEGDRVRSLVQNDDLRVDEIYTVVQVNRVVAPGQCVEYDVQSEAGEVITVTSAHLLFELVEEGGAR